MLQRPNTLSDSRIQVRVWSLAELTVGLFSACLLTYGPILRLITAKVGEVWRRSISSPEQTENPMDSHRFVDSDRLSNRPMEYSKEHEAWCR